MPSWFETPPGQYLLAWEQARFDEAVADAFGFHALQLGLPALPALRANRMPHQWLAVDAPLPAGAPARPALVTDFAALPFPASSLDLVLLPHALECSADPHATLREVERVLVPEGRVVICGFNPASLWGLRHGRPRGYPSTSAATGGEPIGYWRLRDWLRLLSFEVESGRFGCYRPAVRSSRWLERWRWMDAVGQRWWPIFGAAYCLSAVKRVHGMRLIEPVWSASPAIAAAPVSVANRRQPAAISTRQENKVSV
ncbi:class I SAM-dependent methyltransferase [Curvibacter soli]|uniref:class I SAM-dependent methyltransferase n=1 Tax=Curvibacter soli TaxID=3031331 RepID=UPI003AF04E36